MKNKLMIALLILGVATIAYAVPQYFNYQGILRNSAGDLQNGTFSMVFKIYDQLTDGTAVYNAAGSTTQVSVSNGLYNAQLPATAAVFAGADRWIEVTVDGDVLAPRLKINSVAYAVQTENADYATTAGTATNADYATLSGTATNAGTVDNFSAIATPTANQLYPLNGNARLSGVSISAEANGSNNVALSVNGTMEVYGIAGTGQINSGSTFNDVTNSYISSNSIILLTAGHAGTVALQNTNGGIRISVVAAGTGFRVSTMDGIAASANIPFSYLIIN